jgi:glycosyltransferase involved in cell wall biosynthesis
VPPAVVMLCDVDLGRPDGSRTHTVEVARGLAAEGLDVVLVARGPDPAIAGVRYRPGAPSQCGRLARLAGVNRAAIGALRAAPKHRRALYVRKDWGSLPALAVARLMLRCPATVEVNDMPYGRGYRRAPGLRSLVADRGKRLAAGLTWRLATRIIAITGALSAVIQRDWGVAPEKIAVIGVGVDPGRFSATDRSAAAVACGLDPARRRVLFVGALVGWVDFATLIAGVAAAAESRDDLEFVIVGDGPLRPEVERLLSAHGIAERTVLTGFVADRDRLAAYIAAANVCLLCHRVDLLGRTGASPAKLGEYLAAGRAVLAVRLPGVEEALTACGGVLVDPGDAAAYGAALGRLLDAPADADRLGAGAAAAVREHYTWEAVARRTVPLLWAR